MSISFPISFSPPLHIHPSSLHPHLLFPYPSRYDLVEIGGGMNEGEIMNISSTRGEEGGLKDGIIDDSPGTKEKNKA